jgi:hypothetical protein
MTDKERLETVKEEIGNILTKYYHSKETGLICFFTAYCTIFLEDKMTIDSCMAFSNAEYDSLAPKMAILRKNNFENYTNQMQSIIGKKEE